MKIGGLDIGTTGCKLTVFSENGAYLGKAYRDYPVKRQVSGHEIDYSLATRTMAFDIEKLAWSEEVFEAAGIDMALMSAPVPTGTPAGKWNDIVIVSISHDQVAAAVGAGAFDGSVAVDGAGTVECLTPIYDSLPDIDVMAKGYFSVVPYVIPGKYVAYAFSYTGGALIQWCMETFGTGETNEALEKAYGKDEPSGILVLPHFAGAATPYMDTGSKGAIIGLTTATTAADIYRATAEGAKFEDFDEEIGRVHEEKIRLLGIKAELEMARQTNIAFDRRMDEIDTALAEDSGAIEEYDDVRTRQLISNIKVLDKESLLVRFKDGTEIVQHIERKKGLTAS